MGGSCSSQQNKKHQKAQNVTISSQLYQSNNKYFDGVVCKHGQNCWSVLKGKYTITLGYLMTLIIQVQFMQCFMLLKKKMYNQYQIMVLDNLRNSVGVYVTNTLQKAASYGDEIFIIIAKVGKVKRIESSDNELTKKWHQAGYDTAYVPPKNNNWGLSETCVYDPKNLKIVKVVNVKDI